MVFMYQKIQNRNNSYLYRLISEKFLFLFFYFRCLFEIIKF